jgi:hypothetical protein
VLVTRPSLGASASFSASPPWTSLAYAHTCWEYCILTPKSILLRLMYSLFRSNLPDSHTVTRCVTGRVLCNSRGKQGLCRRLVQCSGCPSVVTRQLSG